MRLPVLLLSLCFLLQKTVTGGIFDEEDRATCSTLSPENNVEYRCRMPDGGINNCTVSALPPFTVAAARCSDNYRSKTKTSSAYRYKQCKLDGTWTSDDELKCIPDCGRAGSSDPVKTNGEKRSQAGKWPWHAALYVKSDNKTWTYICGGTLISNNVILTAAHCVAEPFTEMAAEAVDVKVAVGKFHKQLNATDPHQQISDVDAVHLHPRYSGTSFDSDIALLILKTPVTYTAYVRPVCYPSVGNTLLEEYQLQAGNPGVIVGWGVTDTGEYPDELHEVQMPVISFRECTDTHRLFFQSYGRSTIFCAGYINGAGVCSGDSGGGMVFPSGSGDDQRWYLQGVVSVGVPDPQGLRKCNPRVYALFTRVGRYAEWIARVLEARRNGKTAVL